jgi:hypothetical protein
MKPITHPLPLPPLTLRAWTSELPALKIPGECSKRSWNPGCGEGQRKGSRAGMEYLAGSPEHLHQGVRGICSRGSGAFTAEGSRVSAQRGICSWLLQGLSRVVLACRLGACELLVQSTGEAQLALSSLTIKSTIIWCFRGREPGSSGDPAP